MPDFSLINPTVQAIVTAVCGFGAIGYFLFQVYARIKVDDRRSELDAEQKHDRSSLRARNEQLEQKVATLQDRLIEATAAASGSGSCVAQMTRQIIQLEKQIFYNSEAAERRIKELEAEVKALEQSFDECEAHAESYRMMLAHAKIFMDGCKNCRDTETFRYLRRELPKYLPGPTDGQMIPVDADTCEDQ